MIKYQNYILFTHLNFNNDELDFFEDEDKSPLIYAIKYNDKLTKLKFLDDFIFSSIYKSNIKSIVI